MTETSNGPIQHFEFVRINNTDSYSNVTIEVNGYGDFEPVIALYETGANDRLDSNFDDPATLEFTPEEGKRYSLLIVSVGEMLNRNYQLKTTGVEAPNSSVPGRTGEPVGVSSNDFDGESLNQAALEWLGQLRSHDDH